jgi:hypothetical protein
MQSDNDNCESPSNIHSILLTIQVEALRRADHPPKESYRLCMIKKKPKWNGQFHGGRPRPNGAVVPMKKKSTHDTRKFLFLFIQTSSITSDTSNCSLHPLEILRNIFYLFFLFFQHHAIIAYENTPLFAIIAAFYAFMKIWVSSI